MTSRRSFVEIMAVGAGAFALGPAARRAVPPLPAAADAWDEVPRILARIKAPVFRDRVFDPATFGAVGDGVTDCTRALQRAIDDCSDAGGGRVVVPEGRCATSPLRLKSNVNLVVPKGATLLFTTDVKRFPIVLTRFEGVELMNYSPLVYALEADNIAISGEGTLDGQAGCDRWWHWKGRSECVSAPAGDQGAARTRLFRMAEDGVPVEQRIFGEGSYLRPSFIEPYRCRNVLIDGVTIVNSPMWEIHPVLSTNVTVRNVTIVSHGPNNDGCDPESCRDVLIEGCTFDTGDDCIAIKSGRNADGRRINVPSENIVIRNCTMRDGHGGVTIGSEISGGVRKVFAEKCEMNSPRLDRVLRVKTNAMRGGVIEDIYMRDVRVGEVADAILSIDFTYEEGANGPFLPTVRTIDMRGVTSRRSAYGLYLRGFERAPITGVRIVDCTFDGVAKPDVVEHVRGLVEERVRVNGRGGAPDARPWSTRMADAVMRRNPVVLEKWDYTAGLILLAIERVGARTDSARYGDYVRTNVERVVAPDGTITGYRLEDFNLDQVSEGRAVFALYERTKGERYRKALARLREQLARQPRTNEGGFWHKRIYPYQMWLDGLYQAGPFYAQYAAAFGPAADFDDILRQFQFAVAHTRDPRTGLLYHGWDEARAQPWADRATGQSKSFWARAVGWYLVAAMDVLDYLPEPHPGRASLLASARDAADAVAHVQDHASGLWYNVLDQPGRAGNYLEASASAMFAYAFAKGARTGRLDARFRALADRAFDGLMSRLVTLDPDGLPSLTGICKTAGLGGNPPRDGSFEYYASEPVVSNDYKGVAPFILAALELNR